MLKKFVTLLVVLVSTNCFAQFAGSSLEGLSDSEVVSSMKEQVGYIASAMLEGRAAGSEGERMAAEFISSEFASYGLEFLSGDGLEAFGILQESGDTLRSRNVVAFIPGYDKELKNRYVVICARMDNLGSARININGEQHDKIYYGANGNASGLSMMLQLARKLSINRVLLKRSVIFLAAGASQNSSAGSWYFLNRSFGNGIKIDACVNLDMLGLPSNGIYAYTSSNQDINDLIAELSGTLQPVLPRVVAEEPVASDHRSFYEKEIPSVLFTTGMYPEYNTERDTPSILEYHDMERELEYIYNFSLSLVNRKAIEFRRDNAVRARQSSGDVYSYADCDVKPRFLGSSDPSDFLRKWVYVYQRYPREAVRDGIQGRVLVDFIIDQKGKVTDVKAAKGVDELLDAEAVRVISSSPDWKPAVMGGKKVKCAMSVYVDFKLQKRK